MPQLDWNETDAIECLGVLPEKGDYSEYHAFKLNQDGVTVSLTLWEYESFATINFAVEGKAPHVSLSFIIRDRVELVSGKQFSSLKFRNCVIVSDRFWMYHDPSNRDLFDKSVCSSETDLELVVFPTIQLQSV